MLSHLSSAWNLRITQPPSFPPGLVHITAIAYTINTCGIKEQKCLEGQQVRFAVADMELEGQCRGGTGAPVGKPPVIFQSPHLTKSPHLTTPRSRHVPLLARSASARLRPAGLVTCGLEATPPS